MQSRRDTLKKVLIQPTTHTGLWLDKYLKVQSAEGCEDAKLSHLKYVDRKPIPSAYQVFFKRWKQSLEKAGTVTREAQAQGRLAIGLGGESVLETSITLHRTYGVPCIPGSALKGLAAHYARNHLEELPWGKDSEAYGTLFGDATKAGYVTFFDALYIPGSAEQDSPLALDVIAVHHPEYYRSGNLPPADWDNPSVVPFLSATGSYLVAVHGPNDWAEATFKILQLALAEEGIGAKTSSGYGRMIVEDAMSGKETVGASTDVAPRGLEQDTVTRFLSGLEQMPHHKVGSEIHGVYRQWQGVDISDASKRKIAQAILDKVEYAGRTKKSANKEWFQKLQSFTMGHSPAEEE